jgi:hypothetical protein
MSVQSYPGARILLGKKISSASRGRGQIIVAQIATCSADSELQMKGNIVAIQQSANFRSESTSETLSCKQRHPDPLQIQKPIIAKSKH